MTIVVDANIFISALITPDGKIAKLLAYPHTTVKFISCNFLLNELQKHHSKIAKYARKTEDKIADDILKYLKNIQILDEKLIDNNVLKDAVSLTSAVDLFDVDYVALALQTDSLLWTGDKKLTKHLAISGYDKFINTSQLYALLGLV